jgi:hypothetical protein
MKARLITAVVTLTTLAAALRRLPKPDGGANPLGGDLDLYDQDCHE